jgi:uncharacterized protein YndB with AHSA1/START domain
MAGLTYAYVTYMAASPERLWRALLEPEMTRRWWSHVNVSDWQPGSRWEHHRIAEASYAHEIAPHGNPQLSPSVDLVGKVLESAPPRRLVLTWARPADEPDPARHSRASFSIDAMSGMSRLSVLHEELDPEMFQIVQAGWPWLLSSLKSLLETGLPLPPWDGSS